MKILLVAPYGGVPGGISRWTGHLMNYYKQHGIKDCEVSLVPMGRSTFVNINSNVFYRLWAGVKDYRSIFKNFKQSLIRSRHDVLHLTSSGSWSLVKDIYMLRRAKKAGVKTVIHFHFGRIPELFKTKTWEYKLLLKVLKLSDRIIVIDKASYDNLVNSGYTNVENLPNPISPANLELIAKAKGSSLREHNLVLFVGHVVPTKGIFELVEACKQIPNIRLKMVGALYPGIKEELFDKANIGDNTSWIEITGEMPYEEVLLEMMKCTVFVLPTYTEGFPNVILESMACGCPIVASGVGAIPQMLDIDSEKPCGIVIPPKDTEILRSSIVELLDNKEISKLFAERAEQRVNEKYSMETIWTQLLSIWTKTAKQ